MRGAFRFSCERRRLHTALDVIFRVKVLHVERLLLCNLCGRFTLFNICTLLKVFEFSRLINLK